MSDQVSFHLFAVEYCDPFCESLTIYSRDKLQLHCYILNIYPRGLPITSKVLGMGIYLTNSTIMYSSYEFINLTSPTHRKSPWAAVWHGQTIFPRLAVGAIFQTELCFDGVLLRFKWRRICFRSCALTCYIWMAVASTPNERGRSLCVLCARHYLA